MKIRPEDRLASEQTSPILSQRPQVGLFSSHCCCYWVLSTRQKKQKTGKALSIPLSGSACTGSSHNGFSCGSVAEPWCMLSLDQAVWIDEDGQWRG
jgi:hypothetical protein